MKFIILFSFILIVNIANGLFYRNREPFSNVDSEIEFKKNQKDFLKSILELEMVEMDYSKRVSDGLFLDDKENYSLEWYKKCDSLEWNYEKNILHTIYKNVSFPATEFACDYKSVCRVNIFDFDLLVYDIEIMYTTIIKNYIKLFRKRIDMILN